MPAGTQIFGTFCILIEVTSGPAVVAQVGVNPSTTYPTGVALYGFVPQENLHGLWANSGVKLPDRSGKTRIPSGKSSVSKATCVGWLVLG